MLPLPPPLLPHILSHFVPQLSALCLSITLLFCPFSLSHSIVLSTSSLFLSFHILYPTWLFFIFFPLTLSVSFVLQASELGMTSAFYKYILTTMVRAYHFYPILSPFGPLWLHFRLLLSPAPPLLSLYERAEVLRWRKCEIKGENRGDRERKGEGR